MGNATEIAKWVKSLNNKTTKCITSNWRPTKVRIQYYVEDEYRDKIDKAVELAVESAFSKTIVFVHSKVTGVELVKKIRSHGARAVFHNAFVSAGNRKKIETAFNDPMSGLNIVVATSTLGAGVNAG